MEKTRIIDRIITLLPKLAPKDFFSLLIALDIKVLTKEIDKETKKAIPRDAMDLIKECVNKISTMNNKDQLVFLRLIEEVVKKNGTIAEDQQEE